MNDGDFVIIGVHTKIVPLVDDQGAPVLVDGATQNATIKVARVRMCVGKELIDEDFPWPEPLSSEELLQPSIKKRQTELLSNILPEDSLATPKNFDIDQVLVEGAKNV